MQQLGNMPNIAQVSFYFFFDIFEFSKKKLIKFRNKHDTNTRKRKNSLVSDDIAPALRSLSAAERQESLRAYLQVVQENASQREKESTRWHKKAKYEESQKAKDLFAMTQNELKVELEEATDHLAQIQRKVKTIQFLLSLPIGQPSVEDQPIDESQ